MGWDAMGCHSTRLLLLHGELHLASCTTCFLSILYTDAWFKRESLWNTCCRINVDDNVTLPLLVTPNNCTGWIKTCRQLENHCHKCMPYSLPQYLICFVDGMNNLLERCVWPSFVECILLVG